MSTLYIRDTEGGWHPITSLQGEAGRTPERGVDYFTEADKEEFLTRAMASLPSELWTFTLEDGSTVEKQVIVK
ncbi:MAG: hypothetical protein IKU94_10115 [Bacteroidaceae bacterium]|nr:hypothetical protein [Bacteroidaceae bacterium]